MGISVTLRSAHTPPQTDRTGALLLDCVRHFDGTVTDLELLATVDHEIEWDRLVLLAEAHGLMPLVYVAFSQLPTHLIAAALHARLWAYTALNAERNLARARELTRLLDILRSVGIRAVPFKGPVLAMWLYRDLSLRVFGDLDLLVKRADVLRARDKLADEGYHSASPMRPEDEAAFLAAQRQYDFELAHEQTRELVEVHWKTNHEFVIERLDDPEWWTALEQVDIDGTPVLSLNRRETMFTLLIHGSKHLWSRLSWLVDIALLVRKFDDTDWDWLIHQARTCRCKRRIGLGLLLARDLFGVTLTKTVTTSLCSEAIIERTASYIRQRAFAADMSQLSVIEAIKLDLQLYDTLRQRVRGVALLVFTPNAHAWTEHGMDRDAGARPLLRRWQRLFEKYARH
jgi:hypothetical protein